MILKRRVLILVAIITVLIMCFSGLVHEVAEKLYKDPVVHINTIFKG